MSKISLDRLKEKYPDQFKAGTVTGTNYRDLMSMIIADNSEKISKKITTITKDKFDKEVSKMGKDYKRVVVPDISDVLPQRSVFIRKSAEKGNLITDNLRDKLTKDLRQIIADPKYSKVGGKGAGTLKASAIADFEKSITESFANYTKRDPKLGIPKNIHTIAVTEVRSTVNQIRHDFNAEMMKKNPQIESKKMWVHNTGLVQKKYIRQAHLDLSGTEVGINEKFKVFDSASGRNYMVDFPHSPDLPASSVIGCQCECQYFVRVKKENE